MVPTIDNLPFSPPENLHSMKNRGARCPKFRHFTQQLSSVLSYTPRKRTFFVAENRPLEKEIPIGNHHSSFQPLDFGDDSVRYLLRTPEIHIFFLPNLTCDMFESLDHLPDKKIFPKSSRSWLLRGSNVSDEVRLGTLAAAC